MERVMGIERHTPGARPPAVWRANPHLMLGTIVELIFHGSINSNPIIPLFPTTVTQLYSKLCAEFRHSLWQFSRWFWSLGSLEPFLQWLDSEFLQKLFLGHRTITFSKALADFMKVLHEFWFFVGH
jgi:hypothetical protein